VKLGTIESCSARSLDAMVIDVTRTPAAKVECLESAVIQFATVSRIGAKLRGGRTPLVLSGPRRGRRTASARAST